MEEDVVRVLVGNKMDLLDLPSNGEESDENKVANRRSRQVPTATGLQLSEVYIFPVALRINPPGSRVGLAQGRELIEH